METEQERGTGTGQEERYIMETESKRETVVLTDSQTIPGSVALSRVQGNGKLYGVTILSRAELQAIVQQAHDRYGITADPFATPGSADAPMVPGDRRGLWLHGQVPA